MYSLAHIRGTIGKSRDRGAMHFGAFSLMIFILRIVGCHANSLQGMRSLQAQLPQLSGSPIPWDEQKYDCLPEVYAQRHNLQCDLIGDQNAVLLAAALIHCRMPPGYAPKWKCQGRNLHDLHRCIKNTPRLVFVVLVNAYFEVFEHCSKKVSADSVKHMYDLAISLSRVSKETIDVQEEQRRLIKEMRTFNKEAESVQKDAMDVVEELTSTRKAGIDATAGIEKLLTVLPELDSNDSTKKSTLETPTKDDPLHGGVHPSVEHVRQALSTLEDLNHEASSYSWKVGRAAKLSTKVSCFVYIWAAITTYLVIKRTRWSAYFLDVYSFSLIFFVCALLTSFLLKLLLLSIATLIYCGTHSENQ